MTEPPGPTSSTASGSASGTPDGNGALRDTGTGSRVRRRRFLRIAAVLRLSWLVPVLLTPGWDDGDGRLFVLPDAASLRLEFGPGC